MPTGGAGEKRGALAEPTITWRSEAAGGLVTLIDRFCPTPAVRDTRWDR
jgi:hypothetical protein